MTEPFSKFRWNDHPTRVKLRGAAAALATEMYNRADPDGTRVWGKQENLAEQLGYSVRSIRLAQQKLETLGLIRLVSRGSSYGNASNRYELTMPPAAEPDRQPIELTGKSSPATLQADRNLTGNPLPADRQSLADLTGNQLPPNRPSTRPGVIDPGSAYVVSSPEPIAGEAQPEPSAGSAAEGPLPPQLTNEPTEETHTMSRNSTDPWATPIGAVATNDIWDPQPAAVESATDSEPTPNLGTRYPGSFVSLDEVIPPVPMTPQLVRRPDGSLWDPFDN